MTSMTSMVSAPKKLMQEDQGFETTLGHSEILSQRQRAQKGQWETDYVDS